mgnify:FL=1
MLVLKRGKIVKMEGVVLPDVQIMREIEDRGYRYLGILETDHLREKEMKDLFSKEHKHRLKLVLERIKSCLLKHTGSCNSKVWYKTWESTRKNDLKVETKYLFLQLKNRR